MKKLLLTAAMIMSASFANAWTLKIDKDEMTEQERHYIFSERVQPMTPLSWPYKNPTVYMYYDCQAEIFVMRNSANNLLGLRPSSYGDYSDGTIRVKADGKLLTFVSISQSWGSEFISIDNGITKKIDTSKLKNELIIELDHYGDGLRLYKFDMKNFDISQCPSIEDMMHPLQAEWVRIKSEFMGRLRDILDNDDTISIVGDKFVIKKYNAEKLAGLWNVIEAFSLEVPKNELWGIIITSANDSLRNSVVRSAKYDSSIPHDRIIDAGWGETSWVEISLGTFGFSE